MFRNVCRFPTTLHVHGLRFNKNDEGSGYDDSTSGASKNDDGIPTGFGLPTHRAHFRL